jgi:hypothetical protein
MTAQEFTRLTAGRLPSEVQYTQPPPADMPPLPLMILDALVDDSETIYSLRNCGDLPPDGIARVGEAHILDALRSLLTDGLIEVEHENVVVGGWVGWRRLIGEQGTNDCDLRRYWFRITAAGLRTWEAAADLLEAYWDGQR